MSHVFVVIKGAEICNKKVSSRNIYLASCISPKKTEEGKFVRFPGRPFFVVFLSSTINSCKLHVRSDLETI